MNRLDMVGLDDQRLGELKVKLTGPQSSAVDSLLRVLVYRGPITPRKKNIGFISSGQTLHYYECSLDDKMRIELARWITALKDAVKDDFSRLRLLSTALCAICERESKESVRELLARTLRMLQLYEALLLPETERSKNPYATSVNAVQDLVAPLISAWTKTRKHDNKQCVIGKTRE